MEAVAIVVVIKVSTRCIRVFGFTHITEMKGTRLIWKITNEYCIFDPLIVKVVKRVERPVPDVIAQSLCIKFS